jgi:pimeloyl-ACP methyl ester carboxylesterase
MTSRLHVDEYGAGPVVVFVHGVPSLPDDFVPIAKLVEASHRGIVLHLPGYGKTPAEAEPTSVLEMSRRIERRLTELGVAEAVLVAFSGGVPKAVEIALAGSIRVSGLVLLAPVVGLDPPAAQAYRDIVAQIAAGRFDPRPTWVARMTSPGFAERNRAGAARVLRWLDEVPVASVCGELLALAEMRDLRPYVSALACPVLVLSGSEDQVVPLEWAANVAANAQRGRLEVIAGAGHAALVEQPEAVARLVQEFLNGSN